MTRDSTPEEGIAITTRTFAGKLQAALADVDDLRHDLGLLKQQTGRVKGGGLVELDISRALVALGATRLALERGRRHAELR